MKNGVQLESTTQQQKVDLFNRSSIWYEETLHNHGSSGRISIYDVATGISTEACFFVEREREVDLEV